MRNKYNLPRGRGTDLPNYLWVGRGGMGIWQVEISQYLPATLVNWRSSCRVRDACPNFPIDPGDFVRAIEATRDRILLVSKAGRPTFSMCNTESGTCGLFDARTNSTDGNGWREPLNDREPPADYRTYAQVEGWFWNAGVGAYERRAGGESRGERR